MSTRREFLQLSAAGLAMTAGGLLIPSAVLADPDPAPSGLPEGAPAVGKDPEIFPFMIGDWEAFVIHDGVFYMPGVQPFFVPTADPKKVQALLKANHLRTDRTALSINILVVKSPHGVLLVDSGTGPFPTGGRLMRGLEILGIKPNKVAAILLTHAHFDHIGGLVTPDGKPAFPGVKVLISRAEWNFWKVDKPDLSRTLIPAEMKKMAVESAHKCFKGLGPALKPVDPGLVLPGVEFVPALGHTHGHMAIRFTSGSDKLLHVGDAIHIAALQMPHPEWGMAGDSLPELSNRTRRAILEKAAQDGSMVMTGHFPFPGVGYVERAAGAFRWAPRAWVI